MKKENNETSSCANSPPRYLLRYALFILCMSVVAPLAWAASPSIIEINRSLDDDGVITLDEVNVDGYNQKKVFSLDDSFLYNIRMGRLIDLYTYIARTPSLLDATVLDGVYNVNLRGINTSPLNGTLPFSIVIDGVSFSNAFSAPRHAYLLPVVDFYSGVNSFNDLSSGSQGVFSVTSSDIAASESVLTVAGDSFEQKAFGVLSGRLGNVGYYGFNFNTTRRPGFYKRDFHATEEDKQDGILVTENSDDQLNTYANLYAIFRVTDNLEARVYGISSKQNRAFLQGYQTSASDVNKFLTPQEVDSLLNNSVLLSTSSASADVVGSRLNSDNTAFGVDGSYYFEDSIFQFGINGQRNVSERVLHIGNNANAVTGLNATYQENETIESTHNEVVLRLLPISKEESEYRLGLNIQSLDEKTKVADTRINVQSTTLGDSTITLDHSYKKRTLFGQAYGDYKFPIGDSFFINAGGLFVGFSSTLQQVGSISESDNSVSGFGVIAGLNQRLQDVGSNTRYSPGAVAVNSTFQGEAFLARGAMGLDTDIGGHGLSYFANYYEGYIPGGINPYVVSDTGRLDNVYQAQINKTTELVFALNTLGGWNFDFILFSIDMENVHFLDSINGLEKYYGNAKKAQSQGAEIISNYRIFPTWEVDMALTGLDAKYSHFTHTPFSNAAGELTQDYAGNRIILSPRYTARFGSAYWWQELGFYTRLESVTFGPHYFDYANNIRNEGYTLLSAEIGWENETWAFELHATNLLDQQYNKGVSYSPYNSTGNALQAASSGSDSTFTWQDTVLRHIGQPRTITLVLSGRF